MSTPQRHEAPNYTLIATATCTLLTVAHACTLQSNNLTKALIAVSLEMLILKAFTGVDAMSMQLSTILTSILLPGSFEQLKLRVDP